MSVRDAPVFGALLRRYRRAAGLTQEALAERALLSVFTISALERGANQAPRKDTLVLLADALELAPDARAAFDAAARRRTNAGPAALTRAPGRVADRSGRTNLPLQLTSFVGREREQGAVTNLLASTRLLTLVGTGGVGKTRLALQVATSLRDRYPQGVWLAELAPLADHALVPGAVTAALGLPEQPGRTAADTLLDALRTRQLLLVLDNCEHLLDACARLAEVLLRACPGLRILATSREPLGLAGEARWRVPSLSLPAVDQRASPEVVARCDALQLFLERARAVRPSFALTAANAPTVSGICARLDGIPLALELAASRLSTLGVADLAARLDQRFQLLTGGSRTALPRQQTLRATVEWSYSLLTPEEQMLFDRLSVFAGEFTLEAAEAVGAEGVVALEEVLGLLLRLAEKSLVLAEETGEGSTRYRLLEMLRQYGRERLQAGEDAPSVQRRHAGYYLTLAEDAEQHIMGPQQLRWLDALEGELDNLRAALQWARERGEGDTGLRLAGALGRFWQIRGHLSEGRQWLEALLLLDTQIGLAGASTVRAKALLAAGVLAGGQSDYERASGLVADALALYRSVGDDLGVAHALRSLAGVVRERADLGSPTALYEESLAVFRRLGDRRGSATVLVDLAHVAWEQGVYQRARALLEEALALFHADADTGVRAEVLEALGKVAYGEGDFTRAHAWLAESLSAYRALDAKGRIASVLNLLGLVVWHQGEPARAQTLYEESLALYRERGDKHGSANSLSNLAWVALEQGAYERAAALHTQSLTLFRAVQDKDGVAECLEGLARVCAAHGQPQWAVRLLGAATTQRAVIGLPRPAPEGASHGRLVASLRSGLGSGAFAVAWEAGQALPLEQVIADALALDTTGTPG